MDSLLSGKHSRTGLRKNSQPIVQPLHMSPFFTKSKSFIHILCWQSCSFSSALWWIRQPYSARAVRLEQRASVIITLMIKDHINSRSKIIADLEVNFPLQWHLWCARVYYVSWAERQWTINYQLLSVMMKARRRNKQRWPRVFFSRQMRRTVFMMYEQRCEELPVKTSQQCSLLHAHKKIPLV